MNPLRHSLPTRPGLTGKRAEIQRIVGDPDRMQPGDPFPDDLKTLLQELKALTGAKLA